MELKRYINIIWRRRWVIILTIVVTMIVVIIGTSLQTPIYQASTTLRIATSAISQTGYDYTYSDRLLNTYIDISTSGPVLAEVMKRLNLSKPLNVTAEIIPNTELIKITVEDTNPNMAASVANTLADVLITQTSQLYTGGGVSSQGVLGEQLAQAKSVLDQAQQNYQGLLIQTPPAPARIEIALQTLDLQQSAYATLLSQYEQASNQEALRANMVTIIEPATTPQSPFIPRTFLNYALGFVIGMVGGVGLVFLFENLDTTLYTLDDIESITKMNTIAKIPKANRKQIDISKMGTSQFAETFRNLATKIQLIDRKQSGNILLIISAEPRQGKSMIVSNLAFALAESGKNVIAVDCDLRRPKLHSLFRISNRYGLRDILERKTDLKESLQKSQYKGITVLTTGPLTDHPSNMLASPQMVELIAKLSQTFDYVLIDTPAILPFSDTEILAHYASGLILVVRQAHAKPEAIQAANKLLALFPDKAIGCIVNQIKDHNGNYGYYRYQVKSESHTE